MKNKLPSSVKVGGVRFKIEIVEMEDFGEMCFDTKTISIASHCLKRPKVMTETLRHELIHAALAVSGISFSDRFEEEPTVRAFENIFFPAWERLLRQISQKSSPLSMSKRSDKSISQILPPP